MSNTADSGDRLSFLDVALMAGAVVVIAAIAIAVFILPPVAAIWSLNTLFPGLAIPIDSHTVVAAWFLMAMIQRKAKIDVKE